MARQKFGADFKAKVALEAIKNELTLPELAKKYNVHPTQVKDWKCLLMTQAQDVFAKKNSDTLRTNDKYIEALEMGGQYFYRTILAYFKT